MKALPISAVLCITFLAGCAVDKYNAAAPSFTGKSAASNATEVVVLLQPIFAGKPFSEIVCDNTIGAAWNAEESRNIGFTQRYASTLAKNAPQLALLATLPANQRVGMSASGTLEPLNIDSRIVVPVGRYIKDNLAAAIGTRGEICEDQECVRRALQERPAARFVSVEFSKFRVAEEKRNTLTIEIEGSAAVRGAGGVNNTVPINGKVNRSLTSEGRWHSDFLKAMNKIANESTSLVAQQIVEAGR